MYIFVHVLQGEDYEVRTYQPTKWVSTTLSAMEWDTAMNAGFRRLFNYIQGNNGNSECLRFSNCLFFLCGNFVSVEVFLSLILCCTC